MSTQFDDMDLYQRRLHNALLVIEAEGYYEKEGYAPMMREAIEHITILRSQVAELHEMAKRAQECAIERGSQLIEANAKIAELQSKLDEMAKQEPVAWAIRGKYGMVAGGLVYGRLPPYAPHPETGVQNWSPLYAHPINLPALIEQERKEEREECAKVCDGYAAQSVPRITASMADLCAAAIRARNQTTRPVSASSK